MHKLKTILIQFNRAFMPVNLFVSLFLLYLLAQYPPSIIFISQAVFLKMGLYAFIFGYQWYMASKNWYYYRNAGFSIRHLFVYSSVVDLALFIIALLFIYLLKHAI